MNTLIWASPRTAGVAASSALGRRLAVQHPRLRLFGVSVGAGAAHEVRCFALSRLARRRSARVGLRSESYFALCSWMYRHSSSRFSGVVRRARTTFSIVSGHGRRRTPPSSFAVVDHLRTLFVQALESLTAVHAPRRNSQQPRIPQTRDFEFLRISPFAPTEDCNRRARTVIESPVARILSIPAAD